LHLSPIPPAILPPICMEKGVQVVSAHGTAQSSAGAAPTALK
jgi:hypothetical protein